MVQDQKGRSLRLEGPKAQMGVGFLGRGSEPPPHQLGGLHGSAVSSPSGVRDEAPAEIVLGNF